MTLHQFGKHSDNWIFSAIIVKGKRRNCKSTFFFHSFEQMLKYIRSNIAWCQYFISSLSISRRDQIKLQLRFPCISCRWASHQAIYSFSVVWKHQFSVLYSFFCFRSLSPIFSSVLISYGPPLLVRFPLFFNLLRYRWCPPVWFSSFLIYPIIRYLFQLLLLPLSLFKFQQFLIVLDVRYSRGTIGYFDLEYRYMAYFSYEKKYDFPLVWKWLRQSKIFLLLIECLRLDTRIDFCVCTPLT